MKKHLSPLPLVATMFLLYGVYSYVTAPTGGDGLSTFWSFVMMGLAFLMIIAHVIVQRLSANYLWVVIIEGVLLVGLYVGLSLLLRPEKINELTLADSFDGAYIAIVYGVTGTPKLCATRANPCVTQIPENRVLLTASRHDDDLPAVSIDGRLPNGSPITGYTSFYEQITCDGKKYYYQSWYVAQDNVHERMDAIKLEIGDYLAQQCAVLPR